MTLTHLWKWEDADLKGLADADLASACAALSTIDIQA